MTEIIQSNPGDPSHTTRIGTGLLAVFCDLAPEWQIDFRPWLADDMFPSRVTIGFGPAASFDLIPDAMTMQSATPPQAFVTCYIAPTLGDLYGAPYQGLRMTRAPRDATYHQQMQNPARYTAGWVGPGIESSEPGFAPVLAIDRFDLAPSDIQAFNIWYETEYLPACRDVPGLVRLRRYLAMEGEHQHFLAYEFSSDQDLTGNAWQKLRTAEIWDRCRFAPGAPAAYRKVIEADIA